MRRPAVPILRPLIRPLAAVVLAAVLLPASAVSAQTTGDAACFIERANAARAARGLPPLVVDERLTSIAAAHAQQMAQTKDVKPLPDQTLIQQAPAGAALLGENVGVAGSCDALHAIFVGYPPEKNRILNAEYTRIGVGVVPVPAETRIYVSEVFMKPGSAGGTPVASPSPTATASPAPSPTTAASPGTSPAASPTAVDPSPTESPVAEAPLSPSPSPTEDATVALEDDETGVGTPILVAFALVVVAAAALGALMQSRRSKAARPPAEP